MLQLSFSSVSFTYDAQTEKLFDSLSFSVGSGWTGIVGPNGAGKSTLLLLAAGLLTPAAGHIDAPQAIAYCDQRTDEAPEGLVDLLCYPDADAGRLAKTLCLAGDWPYRWQTLSHGERKRAQLAVVLWKEPELLLIDEATNHLDAVAGQMTEEALKAFRGVGLIVSHDRYLLDALCDRCLFLSLDGPPRLRPGGISAGMVEADREEETARRECAARESEVRRLRREAARREADAATQDKKRSLRGVAPKDADTRAKVSLARVTGKDGVAGRLSTRQARRLQRENQALEAMERPVLRRRGISVASKDARSDRLLRIEAGAIPLGHRRLLTHPELIVAPRARIGITGPNGSGKSRLIVALLGLQDDLRDDRGSRNVVPPLLDTRRLYLPQELTRADTAALLRIASALPPERKGTVISTFARLGSEPAAVLDGGELSPGEARKLALALGLEEAVPLIIMDEPTNHLDIVSVRCLEEALTAYDGALLLVSHDRAFLDALTVRRWRVEDGNISESPDT